MELLEHFAFEFLEFFILSNVVQHVVQHQLQLVFAALFVVGVPHVSDLINHLEVDSLLHKHSLELVSRFLFEFFNWDQ